MARTAAEELLDLLTAQIKLARAELAADISHRLRRALSVALFVPALLGGYGFAMVALALWLSDAWGRPLAFLAVAGLQSVVGALGLVVTLRGAATPRLLSHAQAEATATLQQTIAAVSPTNGAPKGVPLDA